MNRFFSIRSKFLVIMSALLVSCVAVYLMIAIKVFRNDKTELIFDLNRSMVSNLSAEIETQFSGISDKFKIFALFTTDTKVLNQNLFGDDSEVAFASLYRGEQGQSLKKFVNTKYLETYGLKENFFEEEIIRERPIPFAEILRQGEYFWNATVGSGSALIGYGRSVIVEDNHGVAIDRIAVIGYVKPDKILKSMSLTSVSEVAVVDAQGQILLHLNPDWMRQQKSLQKDPLFSSAKVSKVAVSVSTHKSGNESFLGAFAKTYQEKLFVLARVPEDKVFSAVEALVTESLLFGMIIITVSIMLAAVLSRSLTEPISMLVQGMNKVADGDLTIQLNVQSRDETQLLANSFNSMINDLRHSHEELQEINRDLDLKVKDRTHQLELQGQAVKEAQEALIRTTRLASAGEIAGRTAHEVLNPLTGLLTRVNSIERKIRSEITPQITMMNDIFRSWRSDHSTGGFEKLVQSWKANSSVRPEINLWEEDVGNLESVSRYFDLLIQHLENDVKFLLQEGGRINKIVDGMRKLSHFSSDIKPHSAKKLMIDCRNIMADLFSQHEIEIKEDYFEGDDEILIDRDEFIQSVTNLMRNALQAMNTDRPGHKYFLSLKTLAENQKVAIEISDNGIGIESGNQGKLFEKQFTTKSSEEGTGLGLGISRRFIRAHNGDIQFVSSIPFVETKFKILLPLKSAKTFAMKEGAA